MVLFKSGFQRKSDNFMYIEHQLNDDLIVRKKPDANDILQMHRLINKSERISDDVKEAESNILINSYCQNKELFSNRFIYFRLASVIHSFGLVTNNHITVQNINSRLEILLKIILSKNLPIEIKSEIFNKVCKLYDKLCNKYLDSDDKDRNLQELYRYLDELYVNILNIIDSMKSLNKDNKENKLQELYFCLDELYVDILDVEDDSKKLKKAITFDYYEQNKKIS